MNGFNRLNRPFKYALLSALAAGIICSLLIAFFIEMLNYLFVPSVIIAVFLSAYFSFRRQMRRKGELVVRKIFTMSLEVGTVSHVYAFAIYLPLNFFMYEFQGINAEIFFMYFFFTLGLSFFSILMYIWVAVPLYVGVGFLLKKIEGNMTFDYEGIDSSMLDQAQTNPDWDPLND